MAKIDFKKEVLKKVSEKELNEWIKRNPPPKEWNGTKYSYAYTEMNVGSFTTWYRKNILGYKI